MSDPTPRELADMLHGMTVRVRLDPKAPAPADSQPDQETFVPEGSGGVAPVTRHAAGDTLGRYIVTGRLGRGGMGDVVEVWDEELGRTLAAKIARVEVSSDRMLTEKFLVEAQVAGQLEHPGVVPVHELGLTEDGRLYLVMKRVRGRDLAWVLDRRRGVPLTMRPPSAPPDSSAAPAGADDGTAVLSGGGGPVLSGGEAWEPDDLPDFDSLPRTLHELLDVFVKLCDAVAFAHSRGVVHRDLKPANVMVGEFGEVLLMDWGLAKVLDLDAEDAAQVDLGRGEVTRMIMDTRRARPKDTLAGTVMGTPAYMPPEQAAGKSRKVRQPADVYALGAILYELLTWHPPYVGETPHDVLEQLVAGPPPPPRERAPERDIPWELEAVVRKAMAREAADRYPSAVALRADVEAFLADRTLSAAHYGPIQRLTKWVRRHKALLAVALVTASVAGALAVHTSQRSARQREQAVLKKADEVRHTLARARARLDAGTPAANWPRDRVQRWFDDRAALVVQIDALAALASRLENPETRASLEAEVTTARHELCLAASAAARALGDYALARMWVDRAVLATDAREAAMQAIARARQDRLERGLAEAREVLTLARGPHGGLQFTQLATRLARLDWLGAPLTRLLLRRRHVESQHEWERRLAIGVLGRLGDNSTRGPADLDAVEVLLDQLSRADRQSDPRTVLAIAEALADLRDARVGPVWEALQSRFSSSQRVAISRLFERYLSTSDTIANLQLKLDLGRIDEALATVEKRLKAAPDNLTWIIMRADLLTRAGRHDEALVGVDEAMLRLTDRAELHDLRGRILTGLGRLDDAIVEHNRACQMEPENADYLNHLGLALRRRGRNDEAAATYTRAMRLAPRKADLYNNRGNALFALGHRRRAMADFARAMSIDPNDPAPLVNRGIVRLETGDAAGAIEDLTRAIELDGERELAWLNRGAAYQKLGRADDAIRDLTQSIAIRPHAEAYATRAQVHIRRHDWPKARRDVASALELDPTLGEAYLMRAQLHYVAGDVGSAQADLDRALKASPTARIRRLRVSMMVEMKQQERARAELERWIEADPKSATPHALLGKLLWDLGQRQQALNALDRALELDPGFTHGHGQRGAILIELGRFAEAEKALSIVLKRWPDKHDALHGRAIARMQQARLSEALQDIRRAIELAPDNAYYSFEMGRMLQNVKRYDEALAAYTRALEIEPRHGPALLQRGLVRVGQGNHEAALPDFRLASEVAPQHWNIWAALGRSLGELGKNAEATKALTRARTLAPTPRIRGFIEELLTRYRPK